MVNRAKKIEQKYIDQELKKPISRGEAFTLIDELLKRFEKSFMQKHGYILGKTTLIEDALINYLIENKVINKDQFNEYIQKFAEKRNKELKEFRKKSEANKDGKKKDSKTNRENK